MRKITNYLTLPLNKLDKEEQIKPKVHRRKEIIKIRLERNKIETKIEKIYKTKMWFFTKINKIKNPLARQIENKREGFNKSNQKRKRISDN